MKFKKLGTAVAVSAALGIGVAQQAHADAYAEAIVDIRNFVFTNGPGTTPLAFSDFAALNFQDTLSNTATLGGVTSSTSGSANTFVASTDPAMACVGACGIAQNFFTPQVAPIASASFARADNLLANQPISGTGFPTGVQSSTVAQVWINTATSGGATSDITNRSSFVFTTTHNIAQAGFDFNATSFLQAWTSAGSTFGTGANGDIKWEITLTGGGVTLDWNPTNDGGLNLINVVAGCDLNAGTTVGSNSPSPPVVNCTSQHFHADIGVPLLAGVEYTLSIFQHVTAQAANAATVPEPATLALLGLGLAGLGFVTRRRSA